MWRCPYCFAEMLTRSRSGRPFEEQAGLQSAACPALGRGGQEEGGGALLRQRDLLFARDLVCFARRRALRDARRRALLRHAALRGESISLLCLSLPLLSLSLPWRRRSLVLAFPCIFLFLSGRKNTRHSRTGTPTACIRCAFFYLLFLALQAQQPKIFARFAPLCAPRAINRRG